jgi:D-alanine transaminase
MDAILTRDGVAWEGTKANFFCVTGGVVRTAPNGPRILPGVTRAAALEAARRQGMPVEERPVPIEELFAADEVFLASTTLWTYSLVSVDGKKIGDGKPGRVARLLKEELKREFTG